MERKIFEKTSQSLRPTLFNVGLNDCDVFTLKKYLFYSKLMYSYIIKLNRV